VLSSAIKRLPKRVYVEILRTCFQKDAIRVPYAFVASKLTKNKQQSKQCVVLCDSFQNTTLAVPIVLSFSFLSFILNMCCNTQA
jgi:predicted Na+-dependent transporter